MSSSEQLSSSSSSSPILKEISTRTFHNPSFASRILSRMLESTDASLFDLTVHAGNKTFPCHRSVLAANSPVFRAMFLSDMKESQTGQLHLPMIRADVFSPIRSFMYGHPLRVTESIALPISHFTRTYEIGIPELTDFLDALLTSALTIDNIHLIRSHAEAHSANRLKRSCDRFLVTNMSQLAKSNSFLQSSSQDAQAALNAPLFVTKNDAVATRTAQHVFEAALAWLSCENDQNRTDLIDTMLNTVQVEQLSLPALVRASREPIAINSNRFQTRLLTAFARKAEQDLNFGTAPPRRIGPFDTLARMESLNDSKGRRIPLIYAQLGQELYESRRRIGSVKPFVHDRFSRHHGRGYYRRYGDDEQLDDEEELQRYGYQR